MSSQFLPVIPYNTSTGQQKEAQPKQQSKAQSKGSATGKTRAKQQKNKQNSLYPQPTTEQKDLLKIIERLVDDDLSSKDEFVAVCGGLDRAQFYTVAEERSLAGRCGNPLCPQKQPKGIFCGVKCAQQLSGFSRLLEKLKQGNQEEVVLNTQNKVAQLQPKKQKDQFLVQPIVKEKEGNSSDNDLIGAEGVGQVQGEGSHNSIEGYIPRQNNHVKSACGQQENAATNNQQESPKTRDSTNQNGDKQFDVERVHRLHLELKNVGLGTTNNDNNKTSTDQNCSSKLRTTSLTLENLQEISQFKTPTYSYLKSPRQLQQGILKKTKSGTQLTNAEKAAKKVTFGMPTTVRLPPTNDENVQLDAFDEFLKKQRQKVNVTLTEQNRKLQEELTQAMASMASEENEEEMEQICPGPSSHLSANQQSSDVLKEIKFKKISNVHQSTPPILEELCSSSDEDDLDDFRTRKQLGLEIDSDSDSNSDEGGISFLRASQGYKADLSTFGKIWAFYGDSLTTNSREWLCGEEEAHKLKERGNSTQTAIRNSFCQMMYGRMSGLIRDLQLKVNRDDMEQCLAKLISTMYFRRPLPGFGAQIWNLVCVGMLCALSKHQLPGLQPKFEDENSLLVQFIANNCADMQIQQFHALQEQFLLQQ
eukprot:TRINITY_DN6477_c0_g1_i4.p1 TRINITY_DN6477_c0_g1~~TRINITY_DN6477_c0_g1_i4.p1  ORF type:complete len:646 (-),score=108.33 TRINITY_DN6477_c0_g1_i4:375-2312(-)